MSSAVSESFKLFLIGAVLIGETAARGCLTTFYRLFPFPRLLDALFCRFAFLRTAFSRRLEGPQDRAELNYHFTQLVVSQGYEAEEHFAETEDGFLLVLHRVRRKAVDSEQRREGETTTSLGQPVLLMHGLMMCSEVFVVDKSISLAFHLVDKGYDVWLGNNRGNKYSWMHRRYKRDSTKYWDYSIDELARYDIPTSVQYIVNATRYQSIAYLGFSNGTTQMFAALAIEPTLRRHLKVFLALAPACKLKTLNPCYEGFSLFYSLLTSSPAAFMLIFGKKAMLGVTDAWKSILSAPAFTRMIDFALWHLFGWQPKGIDPSIRELFYAHLYATMSTKVVHHWFQMLRSGSFEFYDDAAAVAAAGTVTVPEYRVESIQTPVILIHGAQDHLSNIEWLRAKLGKYCHAAHEVPLYEHIDFLFAKSAPEMIFPLVLKYLEHWRAD